MAGASWPTFALAVALVAAAGSPAYAARPGIGQATTVDPKQGAPVGPEAAPFALTVSPTRLAVGANDNGRPQKVALSNGGSAPLAVTVQRRNFVARPDGSLDYRDEAPHSASRWITTDVASVVVAPGATQTVTASITVPADPESGDHHVALVFVAAAGVTESNVKINRGIGIPVFITVAGAVDDSVRISDLRTVGFATGGPIAISATVQGTGTVHRDFRATTPLRLEAPGATATFPDFTVLRESTREITTTWDPPLMCVCDLTVAVSNTPGEIQALTVRVVVFPLQELGALLGVLLMALVAAGLIRHHFRTTVARAVATGTSRAEAEGAVEDGDRD
jgi:hypothetical protein